LEDALGAILHVLASASLSGPVNVTAPHPITQLEFVRTLGRVLRRPAVLPVPRFALGLVFGNESAAMMASGQRVLPARLIAAGYRFRFGEVEPALRELLAARGSGS
jgi:NAD dependent epimerase/dehydratase family enzyme